jgi:mannose-1-phosphate guanylyltransferase / mannose-6-phosphate isomerase
MITPIILSGGRGSRLWPVSRETMPKQFQTINGEHTLLQQTLLRVRDLQDTRGAIIVCNEEHRFIIANQIKNIENQVDNIFLEQLGRNTLLAITVAAATMKPEDLLLVLPSDHQINNTGAFCRTVESAKDSALNGELVCFGAIPDKPETGFGYIFPDRAFDKQPSCSQVRPILEFAEKPNLEHAERYIDQGAIWNSGIFMFRADTILEEVSLHQPSIYLYAHQAIDHAHRDGRYLTLKREDLHHCPSISIDYGVMEHTSNAVVVNLKSDWSDVGTWNGVWEALEKNRNGNTISGDVHLKEVKNSCIISESRLVTAIGLDGYVVVETADAVLIAKRDQSQEIKGIVAELKEKQRKEVVTHNKVTRPWGYFECLDMTETAQVKRLVVNPGAKLSLQRHQFREENWVVVKGVAKVTNGSKTFELGPSESTFIPIMTMHQLENSTDRPLEIIEVQTGTYFGEDDIERFEDDYGRAINTVEPPKLAFS